MIARPYLLVCVVPLAMNALSRGSSSEDVWLRPTTALPNGRQIVRPAPDRCWALVPDWRTGALRLQSARRTRRTDPCVVDGSIRLCDFDPTQTQTAMLLDGQRNWHWAYSEDVATCYQAFPMDQIADCLTRAKTLPGATEQWIVRNGSLGDMLRLPESNILCMALAVREGQESVIRLRWKSGAWKERDLARGPGFCAPVMDADGEWLYLSWSDGGGRIWFQKIRWHGLEKQTPEPPAEIGRPGRRPSILCAGGKVFVAYEEWWNEITAKVFDGRQWQTFRLTEFEPRFTVDVSHSAHLALDVHGVPWLLFSDANRRFVYYTRWLGEGWSSISDARGIFQRAPYYDSSLLSADWLSVEKHPPSGELGMVLANASSGVASIDAVPVLRPEAAPGRRVLFLDMLEIAQTQDVDRTLVPAVKDKANPVFTPSADRAAFDHLRVFNHGTVLRENGRFRMWYAGMGLLPGHVPWWEQLDIGYAESDDGRSFQRVQVPGAKFPGGPLSGGLKHFPFVVAMCRDDEEPDPARRYKMIDFLNAGRQTDAAAAGQYDLEAQFFPGFLYTSPDGLRWSREPAEMRFPAGRPISFVPLCLLKDKEEPDPSRRWKAYGFMSLTYRRRAGGLAYSGDARDWTACPRNPVLDPQTNRTPIVPAGQRSQIHDTIVWRDAGLYLCLFQDQRNTESLPLELAVSRDGEHFVYVQPGEPFIPEGGPQDWDHLELLPAPPVDMGDELWFYYAGAARGPGKPDDGRLTSAGLARARKDGFTCLRVKHGKASGSMTTIPFKPAGPCRMWINAVCGEAGALSVELLGTDGKTLAGYAATQCRAIRGNGIRQAVAWAAKAVTPAAGPFRVRIRLEGRETRLYAFGFESPTR